MRDGRVLARGKLFLLFWGRSELSESAPSLQQHNCEQDATLTKKGFKAELRMILGRAPIEKHAPLRQEFMRLFQSLDPVCHLLHQKSNDPIYFCQPVMATPPSSFFQLYLASDLS